MRKILYIYPTQSTFVLKDEQILRELALVESFYFNVKNKKILPLTFIRLLFFLAINILKSDKIVCRFAGYHSVLPIFFGKIFRKKSYIICGGNEGHNFPSFGYGNINRKGLALATGFSLKNCQYILPVHQSLINFEYEYCERYPAKQGIKNLYFTQAKFIPIENGYDSDFYKDLNRQRIPYSFAIVINHIDKIAVELKGLDLIIETARWLPEFSFNVVGKLTFNIYAHYQITPNVKFLGSKPSSELVEFFNSQQFVLQLSVAEGFPNALCEAMLCGCVPIGSKVFSIPQIIGDTGYVLEHKNSKMLSDLLIKATNEYSQEKRKMARFRIENEYPIHRRKTDLAKVLGIIKA